jgi:putative membrane protein
MKAGIALTGVLSLVMAAFAGQDRKPDDKGFDDGTFVAMVGSGNILEVELGKLAQTQAKNADVKKFADSMVHDHTKANEELKKAAKEAGLSIPEKMNADHQKEFDRFKDYKGTNFDQDYMKHMVADHEKDVALFKRASKEAKNEQLRDFATRLLPVLQAHLDAAKKIEVK